MSKNNNSNAGQQIQAEWTSETPTREFVITDDMRNPYRLPSHRMVVHDGVVSRKGLGYMLASVPGYESGSGKFIGWFGMIVDALNTKLPNCLVDSAFDTMAFAEPNFATPEAVLTVWQLLPPTPFVGDKPWNDLIKHFENPINSAPTTFAPANKEDDDGIPF